MLKQWPTGVFGPKSLLAVRHCPKLQPLANQGKLMMGPWENSKNPTLISNLILGPQNSFQGFYLDNVASYHPMQFPGKLMNWTWKCNKKPDFGSDIGPFDPNLGSQFCFMSFTSTSN